MTRDRSVVPSFPRSPMSPIVPPFHGLTRDTWLLPPSLLVSLCRASGEGWQGGRAAGPDWTGSRQAGSGACCPPCPSADPAVRLLPKGSCCYDTLRQMAANLRSGHLRGRSVVPRCVTGDGEGCKITAVKRPEETERAPSPARSVHQLRGRFTERPGNSGSFNLPEEEADRGGSQNQRVKEAALSHGPVCFVVKK